MAWVMLPLASFTIPDHFTFSPPMPKVSNRLSWVSAGRLSVFALTPASTEAVDMTRDVSTIAPPELLTTVQLPEIMYVPAVHVGSMVTDPEIQFTNVIASGLVQFLNKILQLKSIKWQLCSLPL